MSSEENKFKSDSLLNRTPPNDLDAEKSILSAIFINNNTLFDIFHILTPEDFYKGAHKKIFRAILELTTREEAIDLVTVANALKEKGELKDVGGATYLSSIADAAPVAINAIHYANIVRGKASLRQLINACSKIVERCMEEKGQFEEILDNAESSIFKISEKKIGSTFRSLGELINLGIDKLETQQGKRGGLSGLSTGYPKLDKITSGLQSSDLIILAARPSMGKTAFALNIARNVAMIERQPVAIFSLEMSNDQLSMRLLTSEARLDSNKLKNGFFSKEDWSKVTKAAGILNDLPIFIDDTPNIKVLDIKRKARKQIQQHGALGLLIIDYLQLMKPLFNFERRDLEIAEISRSLKALAKELNIPIIALSQLNRMLEQRSDKRPMMSDLRESGALEQDADIITFIYRDEVYNKEPDNPDKNIAEIIVAKNRNGATGKTLMHFHAQYTRFDELTKEVYRESQ